MRHHLLLIWVVKHIRAKHNTVNFLLENQMNTLLYLLSSLRVLDCGRSSFARQEPRSVRSKCPLPAATRAITPRPYLRTGERCAAAMSLSAVAIGVKVLPYILMQIVFRTSLSSKFILLFHSCFLELGFFTPTCNSNILPSRKSNESFLNLSQSSPPADIWRSSKPSGRQNGRLFPRIGLFRSVQPSNS